MIYRAAVLGLGHIGWTNMTDLRRQKPASHVEAWRLCPRATLAAVCDVSGLRWDGPEPYYADAVHLLADQRPDIVSIATPIETHADLVLACAEAGVKAIVCEKPVTRSLTELMGVIRRCQESGSLLFVNHMRRFDPFLRTLQVNLPTMIGPLRGMTGHYAVGLWSYGSHLIDLMGWMSGGMISAHVRAVRSPGRPRPADCLVDGWLRFMVVGSQEVSASLHAHEIDDYSVFDLDLWGETGLLRLTEFGYVAVHHRAIETPAFTGYRQLDPYGVILQGSKSRSFLGPMAHHVVACLDGVESPVSTGEDSLQVIAALQRLEQEAT